MEQLFLHRLLASQKLHVVDEQHVYPAVAVAEARLPVAVVALAAEDGIDQLVDELFAGGVQHPHGGAVDGDIVGDGLQKVRLAQAGSAVNVQGVEVRAGVFRHRLRRGEHEFVALARHERFKGETRVDAGGGIVFVRLVLVGRKVHVVAALYRQLKVRDARIRLFQRLFDARCQVFADEVGKKFRVRAQHDLGTLDVYGRQLGDIGIVGDGRKGIAQHRADAPP